MAPIENWYALLDAIIHKISVFKALSKRGITQAKKGKSELPPPIEVGASKEA